MTKCRMIKNVEWAKTPKRHNVESKKADWDKMSNGKKCRMEIMSKVRNAEWDIMSNGKNVYWK
jgi:hypothetical protein